MKARILLVVVMTGMISSSSFAQNEAARKTQFNLQHGLAIDGYDPVAYFKLNKAEKGKKNLALINEGATYYFSTPESREEFKRNPAKYEPQYGGWCAYAMGAKGEKVSVDPETFKILDGKLYLFYNSFFNNTLKSWNRDEMNLKTTADVNWRKIFH